MDQFSINKAARLMRAGDEFSKTNQKLLEAVSSFVQWLFETIGNCQLPVEIGWVVEKKTDKPIRLGFEKSVGGWDDVYSDPKKTNIYSAISLCQTLAGLEGNKLITWLEQETAIRKLHLSGLEQTTEILQGKIKT